MDAGRHPNVRLLAYSEVEKVEGEIGDFRVTVRKKARYVDESKCTGCGACAEKCPTGGPDAYNMGHAQSKAIYRYFAQGIPSTYTIDASRCRSFQPGKKCGVCAKVCQAGAIDYKQKDQVLEIAAGSIIVATGYDLFDAHRIPEYGYGRLPNVITALEFERFVPASGPTHGHVYRLSDLAALPKKEKDRHAALEKLESAHRLAFIQCVGSRDIRFNAYCSGFCCMHSIKEAIIACEHDQKADVSIFGMDIRAVGKGFDEYRERGARESGIHYIRSRVAEVTETADHSPVIWYEDTKTQRVEQMPVDLVILATACQPSEGSRQLAETLGLDINEYGFIATRPNQPLDTSRPGVFVCGCSQNPMDIPESVAQASSAAARAAQVVCAFEPVKLAS